MEQSSANNSQQQPNPPPVFTSSSGVPNPMAVVSIPNPMEGLDSQQPNEQQVTNNKRTALAGQWRTPPTPFFPNGGEKEPQQEQAVATAAPSSIQTEITMSAAEAPPIKELPNSTEDYAKALQEAYRQGAEAAARAAAAQQQLVSVSSNPDLQVQPAIRAAPVFPTVVAPPTTTTAIQPPLAAPETITSSSTMPPPAPVPAPVILPAPAVATQQQQQQQRSISMPDMASYAAQQEDEKRQKRLARNRASARLRRLRKKNLVDAYETEVVALEKTIKQLQEHQWGSSDPSALLEALSMDRGQQQLTSAEREATAAGILTQQLQFLQQLEDIMQEQHVLYEVAREITNGTLENSGWKDLGTSLQLSSEQCQSLLKEAVGWEEEWHALQTIKTSLQALKENKWLWNEGCASISDQFLSILHKNQISKFLLWADHNAEAIEELDAVHAVDKVTDSPVFQFGVDNNPNELLDDEKQPAA